MISNQNSPDYQKIYADIIRFKYPDKEIDCENLLKKSKLSTLDIISLNNKIFDSSRKNNEISNQRHRSYSESDITEILSYQKKHNLNNSQLANHFKLSRNTVTKWRKLFSF